MKIERNKLLAISALIAVLIYLLIEPGSPVNLSNILFKYESSLLVPAFYMLVSISVSTLFFFVIRIETFNKWLKYVLSWFLPLSFLVIASGTDGAQFGWMPKTALAQVMGTLLVLVTLGFVIVQTLLPKMQKNKK